ncbi:hypothetical protein ACR6C2_16960 [Streptomyces sp. INA 01156]
MVDESGKIRCNDCGMDLGAYPSDYEDGGKETYCGHCKNDRHVCPDPFGPRKDGMKPFTVVKDWDSDMFEPECDDIRVSDDPEIFHVWAGSGSDASDEADRLAAEKFGEEVSYYLHAVAVLKGHSPFAED